MAALDFPNTPTIGQVFEGFIWDGSKWIVSESAVGNSQTITGSSPAVLPSLSSVFLELNNAIGFQQFVGGEIRFSAVEGNPYAVIKSELITGPAPYRGDLVFATKTQVDQPLTQKLRLYSSGALRSGPEHPEAAGGGVNFLAYNPYGAQCFLGYVDNLAPDANIGVIPGYFVGDNNRVPGAGNEGSTGVYSEARVWNMGAALGAEIDAQNLSGIHARGINPNQIFGDGVEPGPWSISMWTQPTGSHPGTSYDISAALGITNSGAHPGSPKFKKGIVIEKDAIRDIGGHKEAIALGSGHQITWYDSVNPAIVNRLFSDGTNLNAYTQNLTMHAVNAVAATLAIGANASGDRSAYIFMGASTGHANQDFLLHRAGGADGQIQFNNQGFGAMVWMTNGTTRAFMDGYVGNFTVVSGADATSNLDVAISSYGGIWATKGLVGGTFGRIGTYLSVGSTAAPANQSVGDLTFTRGWGGDLLTLASANPYTPQINVTNKANDVSGAYWIASKQRDGGPNNGACQVNDSLGNFIFAGKDQSGNMQNAAIISAVVSTVGGSSVVGRLEFGPGMTPSMYMFPTFNISAVEMRVQGDVGGGTSANTITGASNLTANSTGVGSIKMKGATARDSAGFMKIYIGTTAYYVPVFSAITG